MKWRYEEKTQTIRSVPENYWIATMVSWDAAVNHTANAKLIAAAPELLEAAKKALALLEGAEYITREGIKKSGIVVELNNLINQTK